jgi:glycosyltransferase involved in cell wall biosynthesis
MSDWLFSQLPSETAKILCQNDGGGYEVQVVSEVYDRNPEWHLPEKNPRPTAMDDSPDWLELERDRLKEEWRLSTRIVCWSEWCVTCVAADGVPREKCVVVPPLFTPSPAYAACEPQYNRQPFTIIFLGTLCLRKGTHDLVQAVAKAAEQVPVKLVLAGPNQLNPAMLERFKEHIDYRGFVPHSELPALLSQGHALALPSYSEGFGMVQLEAMAAGLPVIRSTNTGEAARDWEEGLVVYPGDHAGLTQAIVTLARDRKLLRDMGIKARLRVNDFSIDAGAAAWDAVVQGAINWSS